MNFLIFCVTVGTVRYSSGRVRKNAWGLLERSPQTPKNFQNVYKSMFNAMFHDIFVIIILGGASVTVTRNSKNAFAGTPRPALRRKRERTAGVGEL